MRLFNSTCDSHWKQWRSWVVGSECPRPMADGSPGLLCSSLVPHLSQFAANSTFRWLLLFLTGAISCLIWHQPMFIIPSDNCSAPAAAPSLVPALAPASPRASPIPACPCTFRFFLRERKNLFFFFFLSLPKSYRILYRRRL